MPVNNIYQRIRSDRNQLQGLSYSLQKGRGYRNLPNPSYQPRNRVF